MNRLMIGLPLAGAMLTASLALAQTPAPSQPTPTTEQAAPGDPAQGAEGAAERDDCAPDGTAATGGSTDEMQAALGDEASGADQEATPPASAAESESETQPVAGPDAGTAPGGAGSTGFTGGLGGSNIGTSQSEELDTSPQQNHPEVASGLDPISGETAVTGPQAPEPEDDGAQTTPTAPDEDSDDQAATAAASDC